jgi:hypothetical protein
MEMKKNKDEEDYLDIILSDIDSPIIERLKEIILKKKVCPKKKACQM